MKALGWIIGLLALLIIAIGIFLVTGSGALLEKAIERYGTQYLGAPVEVAEAEVSIADQTAAVRGLVIQNPPGFDGPPAFRLGNVAMTLNMDQTSSEVIALHEVVVDGADVAALVKGRKSNLQALMDHLNEQLGPAEEEPADESEVKLIIDRFDFTNAKASVESDVLGQAAVNIPDVHLTDIGRDSNGATIAEVLKQVLDPVVRSVTRALVERGVNLEGVRERLEGERDRLEQNLRERAGDALPGGLDRLRDTLRPRSGDESDGPQDDQ
ncbi:MAG TPA: hypothetical protein VF210_09200 [Pseudomonadales bacterium]